MFLPDFHPIIFNTQREYEHVDVFFINDLHFGSALFDERKWESFKKKVLDDERSYLCWIGDLMENAIPGSKSDMFTQKYSPAQQKEWVTEQLHDFRKKTVVVVPGNHEYNRTTKASGLYPLYDCCLIAGVDDKYRNVIGFVDVGVGESKCSGGKKQVRYFGQVQHKAKDVKTHCSADFTDGIDFLAYGHDHTPSDIPRAKLVFDQHNKIVTKRNIEVLDSGSCCFFGGYGAENAYRPQSDKMYKLRLFSGQKKMESTGFYP